MILEATGEDYASLLLGRGPRNLALPDTPIAPPDVLQMLADLDARIGATFTPASWLIVEQGELVGLCAVKQPPDRGIVDIGYGIAPSRQGRGFAGRAVGEIVAWARGRPDVLAVTAETIPAGFASQRLLLRNGFERVGERIDEEDGPVICWRCPTV